MHTKGQLEAGVQQHLVRSWVGGATDLTFPHQHFRVKRYPLSRALLKNHKHRKERDTEEEEVRQNAEEGNVQSVTFV